MHAINVLALPVYMDWSACQNVEEKESQPTHLLSLSSLQLRILFSVFQTSESFNKINNINVAGSFKGTSQPVQEFLK